DVAFADDARQIDVKAAVPANAGRGILAHGNLEPNGYDGFALGDFGAWFLHRDRFGIRRGKEVDPFDLSYLDARDPDGGAFFDPSREVVSDVEMHGRIERVLDPDQPGEHDGHDASREDECADLGFVGKGFGHAHAPPGYHPQIRVKSQVRKKSRTMTLI